MSRYRVTVACLVCAAAWALGGAAAAALPWPAGDGEVVLGYGAVYAAEGSQRTHVGADVRAPAGTRVLAPADAVVEFCGRVPASGGGTALAVSLELPDGRRVTLLPLAAAQVAAGASVSAGDGIGAVAASGDGSLPEPHLHVGLRSPSGAYLDPATLFGAETAPAPAAFCGATQDLPAPLAEGSAPAPPAAAPAPAVIEGAARPAPGTPQAAAAIEVRPAAEVPAPRAATAFGTARAPARAPVCAPAPVLAPAAPPPADATAFAASAGRECGARPLFSTRAGETALPVAAALAACLVAWAGTRRLRGACGPPG